MAVQWKAGWRTQTTHWCPFSLEQGVSGQNLFLFKQTLACSKSMETREFEVKIFFTIEVWLIYNIQLVSGIQQWFIFISYTHIYVYIYLHMCVYICIYIYVNIYTYTYLHIESACHCRSYRRRELDPGSWRFPGERNGNPLQHSCLGNIMDRTA